MEQSTHCLKIFNPCIYSNGHFPPFSSGIWTWVECSSESEKKKQRAKDFNNFFINDFLSLYKKVQLGVAVQQALNTLYYSTVLYSCNTVYKKHPSQVLWVMSSNQNTNKH